MRTIASILSLTCLMPLWAAGPSCPAGMPLGALQLTVVRKQSDTPLPLSRINRIEEGDKILYTPSLRNKEKRSGKVAVVLVAAHPEAGEHQDMIVLEPKDAVKPAEWKAPFRAALAVYVYGPTGLSPGKLKGALSKDQELISQLADYAEKTAHTEAVLQALAATENSGANLQAALQGFAGQFGATNKIDRTAPLDQQTMAAFRALNPALSVYDPVSPSATQRMAQSAGLAATVAGMFLGSTVGLAAGSTAMALNLKTLMFPDTDLRSAYAQPASGIVTLCSAREQMQSRKRLAYLWAMRVPDTVAPDMTVDEANHLPAGLKTVLKLKVPEPQWKLVSRVRDWALQSENGTSIKVPALAAADQHGLEVNLSEARVRPGQYKLGGLWDWDPVRVEGKIVVDPLSAFQNVKLTAASQALLQQHSGKQVVALEGDDFQFVDKVAIVRKGDKYASPAPVPFTLPLGQRRGPQNTLEMQVDTTGMAAGDYSLLLYQQDGKARSAEVQVLPDPPRIDHLPLTIGSGEPGGELVLEGQGLDRITGLSAEGMQFTLQPSESGGSRLTAKIAGSDPLKEGSKFDLKVSVKDYPQPLVLASALRVAGKRPRVRDVQISLPPDLQIAARPGELPAGIFASVIVRADNTGTQPLVALGCRNIEGPQISIQSGSEKERIKLRSIESGSLFLSFDPALWPSGCILAGTIENKNGKSDRFDVGRVLRMPSIESFRLTDEKAEDGTYIGLLTGRDLELIERAGWDATSGNEVSGFPAPLAGEGNKQSLKIKVSWPSPAPHSPLYVWFRGEKEGRSTTVRY